LTSGGASAADPLKMAWVYVGPPGDGGWTYAHDQGRKAVEKQFGDKVKTTFVENVPENADAERVIRDLAAKGNKIIFTTSFGYMDSTLKVAKAFPKAEFYHATGFKSAPNVTIYNSRMYEPAFLAGMIAGHVSKKGVLGFVASFPIPEVVRNINAYTMGARSVNPKITTKVVWVNTWFDPSKERQAAEALIGQGADVLLQNTDSSAVLQTAQDKGVFAFGWDSDMTAYGPKAHLASAIEIWGGYYGKVTEAALAGKPLKTTVWGGIKEGMNDLVSLSANVPAPRKWSRRRRPPSRKASSPCSPAPSRARTAASRSPPARRSPTRKSTASTGTSKAWKASCRASDPLGDSTGRRRCDGLHAAAAIAAGLI
jgi:basic membrane protein A